MLSHGNNPAVSLATRRWLGRMARTGTVLDRPCWELLSPVLRRTRRVHPGGLVHGLTLELGGWHERALLAGSICELFYAACSVTDDLQDGDTDEYLGHLPMSLRINAQTQLVSLVAVRLHELAVQLEPTIGCELSADAYRTLSIMLVGQRLELTREDWDIRAYERVARASAGEQYAFYCRVAAAAALAPLTTLVELGRAVGTLLQLVADEESEDARLVALDAADVRALEGALTSRLRAVADECDSPFIRREMEGLSARCGRCSRGGDEVVGRPSPCPSTRRS